MVCTSTGVDDVVVGVGVGVGLTFGTNTPLFQISLFPDLIQVYFFPLVMEVVPTFVHEAPAFTAEIAGEFVKLSKNKAVKKRATLRMNR